MHAVIVDVTINDFEQAQKELRDSVVPAVSQAPGFVSGSWIAMSENKGHSVVVFETEDAANAASQQVRSMARAGVTIDTVEVRQVVAHA